MGSASPDKFSDISGIRTLVARARRRLRGQLALEGATTAVVLGSVAALASVYAVRAYIVTPATGVVLLALSLGVVIAGAVIAAARRIDDEDLARRIDRASNLSDRLSTAVAFERVIKEKGAPPADDETRAMMGAAIRDAVRAVPRADVRGATPFTAPRDGRVAAVFAGLALLAAGLGLPEREPRVKEVQPGRECHDQPVVITGEWLCGPDADGPASATECTRPGQRIVIAETGTEIAPLAWRGGQIEFAIPAGEPDGMVTLEVWDGGRKIGELPFEVVDCKKERKKNPDAPDWDDDDRAYMEDLIKELRDAAKRDDVPELDAYADRVEQLLQLAEEGELTKEQMLEELKKAEEALQQGGEPDQKEVDKDLSDTGKELEKNEMTKELGKALQENDLEKAKQEMEKLAEKMDKGELTEKQKQDLAKQLEKAAKAYQKKEEQRQKDQQAKIDKAQKEIRQLEKEKDEAKDPKQKEDLERRLEKKKRELEKLEKDKQKKEESEQRRALKRLHKDMKDAAEDLQKKSDNEEQDKQNQRQASQKMKDAAEEAGKVDKDQRKQASQKKVASQMDDLREAMRRAKRRGSKGPKNPFGKNGKQSDFEKRARGGKGSKGAWKPGQGKGKGQQNGGQGDGDPQETNTWGTGHDPNLEGDPTAKSGDTKDEDLQGLHGKGPSRRETILSAAQKGFASKGYQKVYADYKEIVEEVMRSEKVPSSYKYYIKKYFTKIKPHEMD
jgi:hypothetical protein